MPITGTGEMVARSWTSSTTAVPMPGRDPRPRKPLPPDHRNPERGNPETPAMETRISSQSQLSNEPPAMETRGEIDEKILGLTHNEPMLSL